MPAETTLPSLLGIFIQRFSTDILLRPLYQLPIRRQAGQVLFSSEIHLHGYGVNQDLRENPAENGNILASMRLTPAAFICVLFFAVPTTCQEIPWREITIESRWGGLAQSQDLKIVMTAKHGAIVVGKHRIDPKLVDALIASLKSTAQAAPTPSNLGLTQNWLERNVQTPQKEAPNQQALFRESFTDSTTIADLLPFAFQFAKFDDYPQLTITVVLKNGGRWVCSSDSYYPFMLPWKVNRGSEEETTYNADISRAVALLMPQGSVNRNRLSDEELKEWLSDAVMQHIKERWEVLGVENRAPESFAELRHDFEVQYARINPYRSVDYGYVEGEKGPHEENLLATLRQPSLPPNVADDVALLFHDGKIEGVGDLADRIAPYVSLALSVPWLNEYRANHPDQKMYIRFVHDRSFSAKAMQNFTADMEKLGKQFLADEVMKVQAKSALVFLDYGSDWIILPDKRMILWRHYLPASFLKWTEADFNFERCASYNENGGGCVGALISIDGVLQR
ncbi:MAG: hypothetical protein ACLP3K_04090 [Candidatus Acidiferrales bacterium]